MGIFRVSVLFLTMCLLIGIIYGMPPDNRPVGRGPAGGPRRYNPSDVAHGRSGIVGNRVRRDVDDSAAGDTARRDDDNNSDDDDNSDGVGKHDARVSKESKMLGIFRRIEAIRRFVEHLTGS